jgi:putative (di)nucleoside polyphosphate hydrolase
MKPYRKNVGIVVFNGQGRLLAGERRAYPGAYQFPQGGMDNGESPLAAARRELFEETGLGLEQEPAHEVPEWLRYDFPENIPEHLKKYQGQEQKWFFFYWNGDPATLSLDHHEREFDSMAWLTPDEVYQSIVLFKKPVYRKLLDIAKAVIPEFLEKNRA